MAEQPRQRNKIPRDDDSAVPSSESTQRSYGDYSAVAGPHGTATVNIINQFGLTAAPTSFRSVVERFVRFYLGTDMAPVPFGGRAREIKALNNWLNGSEEDDDAEVLAGNSGSNNLLITAPAGRGKTALLVRWIHQLQTDRSLIFVPVSIRYQTNQASTFYQAFAARLAEVLGELLPDPRANPVDYYRHKVIEYLDRIVTEGKRGLVVIDGLDEARGWQVDTTVLPLDPPHSLKIVISARELAGDRGSEDWLNRLGWTAPLSDARTLNVQPLSHEGIADVLRNMAFPIAPLSKDVDIIDELYRLTEHGDPLLLYLYVNDLLKKGEQVTRLTPLDLQNLEPGFGAYFKRWLNEQRDEWQAAGSPIDEDFVDAILAVLATAFGPLELRDVEALVDRVFPGKRIFTVRTVDPLRRFIVGDGIETGYALAHPKLADYLQRDYFGRSKVLQQSQEAFIAWMRKTVQDLNAGRKAPQDAPKYSLLFYTQHLGALPLSADTLELYRELVEDGWRGAWEHHEGGNQGFSRDVELAARAFRTAADKDPQLLREPGIGLGAQVRCALCLSSLRSMGLGTPGELLAEFLRSKSITPKQALYLAQLKEDQDRSNTIQAIIEFLPIDLRLEAYASARDILNPRVRFQVLFAIAPHLPERDQERAFLEALRASKHIKEYDRWESALGQLKPFVPESVWAEAFTTERDRRKEEQQSESLIDLESPTSPPTEQDRSWFEWSVLVEETEQLDLTQERMRHILETFRDGKSGHGYWKQQAIKALAPRLSKELQTLALESIWHGQDTFHRGDALAALVPHLASDLLEEVFRLATTTLDFDLEQALAAVAERLDAAGLEKALQVVLDMESADHRSKALGAIAPHLPDELLREVFTTVRNGIIKGDLAGSLMGLVSSLPRDLLLEAVELATHITDIKQRGQVLAKLLPRLRDADLSVAITDVYRVAFVIGDASARAFAQAALLPSLENEQAQSSLAELANDLKDIVRDQENMAIFRIFALVLTSTYLPDSEAAGLLDQAVITARELSDGGMRVWALGVVATRLPPEQSSKVMAEAVELARTSNNEASGIWQVLLARLRPAEDIQSALEDIRLAAELLPLESKKIMNTVISMLSALLTGNTAQEKRTAVAEALGARGNFPAQQKQLQLMSLLLVLQFSPQLPPAETDDLIRETLAALREIDELEARILSLAGVASYLPTPRLLDFFAELLELGARVSRPSFLIGLAFIEGVLIGPTLIQGGGELYRGNSTLAGNLIPGSPLARLGGSMAVRETAEAIRDVCRWWP